MTALALLDRAVIDGLRDSIGAEGARTVFALFVEESGTYLAAIAAASARPGDDAQREAAKRAAHSLKSAAGQIGAAALAAAATEVERAATTGGSLAEPGAMLARCSGETIAAIELMLAGRER